ncbi:hypothetical protein DRN75_02385 [Nanoarchaeota archaeon]|nr:MAG: hypothetical protein DRN75_02385 [Nanoarchaeota archaeon]
MMKSLVFVLPVLLCLSVAYSMTIGSYVDKTDMFINPGQVATYHMYVFTLDENPVDVYVEWDSDPELEVYIYPEHLVLERTGNNCDECKWFVLRDGISYVKMYPVEIKVRAPSNPSKAMYKIKVRAVTYSSQQPPTKGICSAIAYASEATFTLLLPSSAKSTSSVQSIETVSKYAKEESPVFVESKKSSSSESETVTGRAVQTVRAVPNMTLTWAENNKSTLPYIALIIFVMLAAIAYKVIR